MRYRVLCCCIAGVGSLAHAGATLTDARFTSCAGDACIEVRAAQASEGTLRSGTYFDRAVITLTDARSGRGKGSRVERFRADSLYYDVDANELQIRGITSSGSAAARDRPRDGFIDLGDGQLHQLAF